MQSAAQPSGGSASARCYTQFMQAQHKKPLHPHNHAGRPDTRMPPLNQGRAPLGSGKTVLQPFAPPVTRSLRAMRPCGLAPAPVRLACDLAAAPRRFFGRGWRCPPTLMDCAESCGLLQGRTKRCTNSGLPAGFLNGALLEECAAPLACRVLLGCAEGCDPPAAAKHEHAAPMLRTNSINASSARQLHYAGAPLQGKELRFIGKLTLVTQ